MRANAASNRRGLLVIGLQLAIVVGVIGVWEVGTNAATGPNRFVVDPFIWSRPSTIVARVSQWLQSGIILNNVFITLYEALMSFLLGAHSRPDGRGMATRADVEGGLNDRVT